MTWIKKIDMSVRNVEENPDRQTSKKNLIDDLMAMLEQVEADTSISADSTSSVSNSKRMTRMTSKL